MHDSPPDEVKIAEVLSAFIRDHTPESLPAWSHATTSPCRSGVTTSKGRPPHPPNDAGAALHVLGHRPVLVGNDLHIDLTWTDIAGTSLPGANLDGVDLRCAGLTGAYLNNASLRGASLRWAYLIGTHLTGADLTGAHLPYTNLTGADLTGADLTGADLNHTNFTGADLTSALWPADAAVPKGWLRTPSGRLTRAP
jgi:Pentapeptide repeats (8 copies)